MRPPQERCGPTLMERGTPSPPSRTVETSATGPVVARPARRVLLAAPCLLLTLLLAAVALLTLPAPAPAATGPTAGFVRASGTQLVLDGHPYRFTGYNVFSATGRGYRCGPWVDLNAAFDAWGPGVEVFRTWFFQNLATTDGVRDWSEFDRILATARARGYRVIAVLANQWTSCDEGYGYKTDQWYRGGYLQKDPQGTVSYRDWVREIVDRYKDDPAILMWQLVNEPEANDRDWNFNSYFSCPGDAPDVLRNWAAQITSDIKAIDSNHLVSIGTMGGGPCGTSWVNYQYVNNLPTVDLCDVHDFGNPWSPMPGDPWNGLQAEIDFCKAIGKPIFVGETGIDVASVGGPDARARAFEAKFSAQFSAGVVGELVWNWSGWSGGGDEVAPGDPALAVVSAY